MSLAELPRTEATADCTLELCDHTVQHVDQDGKMLGSWIESTEEYGVRVACRICNKLYGYRPREDGRTDKQLYEAYLEQQRRLACPGCGESPFLD